MTTATVLLRSIDHRGNVYHSVRKNAQWSHGEWLDENGEAIDGDVIAFDSHIGTYNAKAFAEHGIDI